MATVDETIPFTELTPAWAAQVARRVRALGGQSGYSPRLVDVWLTDDLALHVRYHIGNAALAARIGRLDVDPTSMQAPRDSARLASDLFHTLHDAPDRPEWIDELGFGWWGDVPSDGWPAVDTRERLR